MLDIVQGWLGPYLNILPIFTVGLFVAQQKLFMPPPMNEQAAMQQKVMTFMMVFIGFLFFKVASGLCIYFIASSLWGIAERKLLPQPNSPPASPGNKSAASDAKPAARSTTGDRDGTAPRNGRAGGGRPKRRTKGKR
jgi:YidC/Oxa1 family membrane protein insertase